LKSAAAINLILASHLSPSSSAAAAAAAAAAETAAP
jgi:hypothetical protein